MASLIDIHIAEKKLKIISEKQNILKITTIWRSKYILMTYNKTMQTLVSIDWINADEISEEDSIKLTKVIKKCVRGT